MQDRLSHLLCQPEPSVPQWLSSSPLLQDTSKEFISCPGDSPDPMTFSILIRDASISRVNSCTAWQGSSYVWGST